MTLSGVWKLLHLFFAFSFVGSLILADWNGRAARASQDWGTRALLFDIIHLSTRTMGLGSLVLLGVFGNLLASGLGYRMSQDGWLQWVNGLWLAAVLVMGLVNLPSVSRLARAARAAAGGASPDQPPGSQGDVHAARFEASLKRWRLGNAALSLLYLSMLVLMVFRWRS